MLRLDYDTAFRIVVYLFQFLLGCFLFKAQPQAM